MSEANDVDVLVSLNGDYHHDCNALISEVKRLRFELLMVSKVAADEPMFFNPLNAAHAKSIRDRVLANTERYVSSQRLRSRAMDKCNHPKEQREPYHDMTVKCNACNCVIEQFGKPINPPSPLSPRIWPVESSREPACYVAPITREEYEALKKQVENLHDEFRNGIKYNKKKNYYYLVWTEKQVEDARKEADELMKKLKWVDRQIAT